MYIMLQILKFIMPLQIGYQIQGTEKKKIQSFHLKIVLRIIQDKRFVRSLKLI